jgi:YegS/Rv2252/BmrU family lipid kinase
MALSSKAMFIVNPAAGNGRVGRDLAKLTRLIRENYAGPCDLELTRRANENGASELAREAIQAGYRLVVAVGGDGTVNEVLNGLFSCPQSLRDETAFGVLPVGTANDLAATLGMPKDVAAAVRALNRAEPRHVDVGSVVAVDEVGGVRQRYFLNAAEFGVGGTIADRANKTTKAFGRRLSYWWAIFATMLTFKNPTFTFCIDDGEPRQAVLNDGIVANGRYIGGGLKPAPHAQMDDGLFDFVTLGNIGFWEGLGNFPRLKSGTHLNHKKVGFYRCKKLTARSSSTVLVEADGELVGYLPATFEILPRALRLKS